jgi:hypothetical protein
MPEKLKNILDLFRELPPHEQHKVVTEMLRSIAESPDQSLSDEELVGLADDLFQTLDQAEANIGLGGTP